MKHRRAVCVLAALVAAAMAGCERGSERKGQREREQAKAPWRGKPAPGPWQGGAEAGDLRLRVRFTVSAESTSIKDISYEWTAKGRDEGLLTFTETTSGCAVKPDRSFAYTKTTGSWSVAQGVTMVMGGDRSFTIKGAFTSETRAEGTVVCPVTSLGGPGAEKGAPPTRWTASPR